MAAASLVVAALLLVAPSVRQPGGDPSLVRLLGISYRAHDGVERRAYVVLPRWYGRRLDPLLPLVIAPHGRGVGALETAGLWEDLPARGPFALVSPEGQGRRLALYSWGAPGQIDDLARMPGIVRSALPWLRIDPRRIYAVGDSMGGQETLLLLARHPHLLAGAVAFDSVTNFYRRYNDFAITPGRHGLQLLARLEVGGTPRTNPTGYVLRSPTHWTKEIAQSGVPLQLWWSVADQIVVDQAHQSAHFYAELRKLHPRGRVEAVTGFWRHSAEMRHDTQLPDAVRWLGLLEGV
jgi:poly(3-hydroxybutyrate) depolymerase